jgi:hypothetical protein
MIVSPYLLERLVSERPARRTPSTGRVVAAPAAGGRVLWRCGRLIITWTRQSERPARRAMHGGKLQ